MLSDRRSFIKKMSASFVGLYAGTKFENSSSSTLEDINRLKKARPGSPDDEVFWNVIRKHFPLGSHRAYFNTGGLGASPRVVIEAFHEKSLELEREGETGHQIEEEVIKKMSSFLGADTDEIGITNNTTHSINIIARGLNLKKGDEVIMTTHEHPGCYMPWLAVQNDTGVVIKKFEPAITHEENIDLIKKLITKKTKVLQLCHITCTLGYRFPIKELSEFCRSRGIIFSIDGAHPPGMIPLNLHDLGCDFYANSSHKWMLGPKGSGFLYVRKEMFDRFEPEYIGAYSEEKCIFGDNLLKIKKAANAVRYGTTSAPLIKAVETAVDFISTIGIERVYKRGAALAKHLREGLSEVPNVKLLTSMDPECSGLITTFKPLTKKFNEVQKELTEMNFRVRGIHENGIGGIRISTHVYNNYDEIDGLIDALKKILG